jgi:signal transduction protein with GAF and PtsI domain
MSEHEGKDQALSLKVTELILRDEQSGAVFISNTGNHQFNAIVELAAHSFGAAAASIALVDADEDFLFFTAAHGAGKEEIIGKKIPFDVGIAGYVIMNGEPLSIEDVHKDPRFHHSFAESTGYIPSSILAAPLSWADEIIGVLEVLDKATMEQSLEWQLDLLSLFADIASSAIAQRQYFRLLGEITKDKNSLIQNLSGAHHDAGEDYTVPINRDRNSIATDLLAEGYQILNQLGVAERHLGVTILRSIGKHFKDHPGLNG